MKTVTRLAWVVDGGRVKQLQISDEFYRNIYLKSATLREFFKLYPNKGQARKAARS